MPKHDHLSPRPMPDCEACWVEERQELRKKLERSGWDLLDQRKENERLRAAFNGLVQDFAVRGDRIEAALALHSQESFTETDTVTGKDLWESKCPICKTRNTCDTLKALNGEKL